jgi:hypothetical protein
MNPYVKAALFVVRLAGFGLAAIGLFLLASNAALVATRQSVQKPTALALEALTFLAGIAVLWKSGAIARRIVGGLDEDDDDSGQE